MKKVWKELSRIYWESHDTSLVLEYGSTDTASVLLYRRAKLHYKTLALIFDDRLLEKQ